VREEKRGEWGKRRGEKGKAMPRDAAGAPRPGAVHVRGEPYQPPREKPEPSATGRRPEQRGKQRPPCATTPRCHLRQAGDDYTADPT
jgi:hypothetical protein